MYRFLYWLVLQRLPAEGAHRVSFALLRAAAVVPGMRALLAKLMTPGDPVLRVRAFGRELPGPLGLAAGFDKDAEGVGALLALGFGFVEVGTVTAEAQPGNPKPRLFRLTRDRALVNRMGFNNRGAEAAARRLAHRGSGTVGVNIGKTKRVAEDGAIADFTLSAETLAPFADYLVVNVSSPNTPGLRDLQAVDRLRPLLVAVRAACDLGSPMRRVPLLVKIAPDLADADIDAVADLALELGLDGIIATNTTISRAGLATPEARVAALGNGGLSGAPLAARSLAVLRRLRARVGTRLVLIAVGGIESADDAWERIRAGATLVQAYTGFIYGGPLWVRRLHRGLAARTRAAGFSSIEDVVGSDS
ncbi:MAG: quinone-dependent dihydroorotate dehydrogenase [Deltaproteobacteria bacterium]|nr:quinone-dependent dihydroorotate dehydrogenase [Deltaproteobacteria bacterium]MCW5804053.1 quinone-dependent dihydroorotate dehydrogenase [Deltaproteobacteria bacterium]